MFSLIESTANGDVFRPRSITLNCNTVPAWDKSIDELVHYELVKDIAIEQSQLRRLPQRFRLQYRRLSEHFNNPVLHNTRSGMDSGCESDDDNLQETISENAPHINREAENHFYQYRIFDILQPSVVTDYHTTHRGINMNQLLGWPTLCNIQPTTGNTITLQLRIVTGYPIMFRVIHHRPPYKDVWMVITYQKGFLHKDEYDTIIHAQAIHGRNILLAGKCYGHMRVLLVNSHGRLLDVINTMITRTPKKQVSHKHR